LCSVRRESARAPLLAVPHLYFCPHLLRRKPRPKITIAGIFCSNAMASLRVLPLFGFTSTAAPLGGATNLLPSP
ncbi:MAG: hypothetical protein ACREEM_32040, partial [Blastocatellia bacterium]